MANPTEDNEHSRVLLSYRCRYDRRLTWSLVLFILVLNGINVYNLVIKSFMRGQLGLAYFSLFLTVLNVVLVIGLPLWFERRFVVFLACTNAGLEITTARGRQVSIPWAGIRAFRRGILGFAVLVSDPRRVLWFFLPERILNKLLAILREASDARITGF